MTTDNKKFRNLYNPTTVKLQELKAPLQEWAAELDRPLHWLLRKILSDGVEVWKKGKSLNKK